MKPMLAAKTDGSDLRFPLYASPKLDGIRCMITENGAVSRTLKPIPNAHIRRALSHKSLIGLDGELIVGSPTAPDCFRVTSSAVMSHDGEPDFRFYVFDSWNSLEEPLSARLGYVRGIATKLQGCVRFLEYGCVRCSEDLFDYEGGIVSDGYEGIILRSPSSMYKFGRSTLKEQGMLKLKRFEDAEAIIIGWDEHTTNTNAKKINELGKEKRSSHKAGMVPTGKLGAITVMDVETGVEFSIGSGFSDAERVALWSDKAAMRGRLVKYKHFPIGVKDKPRFPTFLGFRYQDDL